MTIKGRLYSIIALDSLVLVSIAMIAPFHVVLTDRVGGDIMDAGFAVSSFAVGAGIISLFSGNLSDRVVKKNIIVGLGYIMTGIGFYLYCHVSSLGSLLAVQLLIGVAQASYAPAFDAMFTESLGSKLRSGSSWGIWESANYFSVAIGSFLASFIVVKFGLTYLFLSMALLCMLSGVLMIILPSKSVPQ